MEDFGTEVNESEVSNETGARKSVVIEVPVEQDIVEKLKDSGVDVIDSSHPEYNNAINSAMKQMSSLGSIDQLKGEGSMSVRNSKKKFPLVKGMMINFENQSLVVDYVNVGQEFATMAASDVSNFPIGKKYMFNGDEYEVTRNENSKISVKLI